MKHLRFLRLEVDSQNTGEQVVATLALRTTSGHFKDIQLSTDQQKALSLLIDNFVEESLLNGLEQGLDKLLK